MDVMWDVRAKRMYDHFVRRTREMYGLLCNDECQLWHVGTGDVHAYVNSCGCARWCIVVPVDVQVGT
jgi:hypothetical protein